MVRGIDHQVGGELLAHELVVRHILVEGTDDPVAIYVGEGIAPAGTPDEIALGVGISRDIQPMPPPAFAKSRRGEEFVD